MHKVGQGDIIGEMVKIRDEVILAEITRLWESRKSILLIDGGAHVLRLMPVIKMLVEKTK